jgi:hypothetical protein
MNDDTFSSDFHKIYVVAHGCPLVTDENQKISRRSVLKGLSATAAAGAGGVSFTSSVAAETDTTKKFLKSAIKADKTQTITDDLGEITLKKADSVVLEHTVERTGKVVIRQGIFFLPAGALIYSETGNGTSDAIFKFGTDRDILSKFTTGDSNKNDEIGMGWNLSEGRAHKGKGAQSHLKEEYQSLPTETSPMILATETQAIFRRNATDKERKMVDNAVPIDITEEVAVITGSDVDGFTVTRFDETNGDIDRNITNVVAHSTDFSPVKTMDATLRSGNLSISNNDVTTASHGVPDCAGICLGCAGSITGCTLCLPACANPIGPLTCPICLFPVCHGVLVFSCAFCAECLDNHYFE